MMKRKKLGLICGILLLAVGGVAVFNLNGDNNSIVELFKSPRDKQLSWLKEHEQEIVEWMKSKKNKLESVQFDWDTLRVGPVSNGLITVHYNLSVKGTFNHIPETVMYIDFRLDAPDSIPSMDRIAMNQPLSIRRGGLLDIYE